MKPRWIGRFAPTPSGPLHFGSLVAALGSYLIARQQHGLWLLRIEDIDPPREMPGATQQIIQTLASFGFEWDCDIVYQSDRLSHYEQAIATLQAKGLTYFCDCSRKTIQQRNQGIYDGFCRQRQLTVNQDCALRLKCAFDSNKFDDRILGECLFTEAEFLQDFVIRRRDGLFAYQLAVVVDDIAQSVNHVVRGADILESTPRQNMLYQYLGKTPPVYYHLPLVVDEQGDKLSKSRFSPAIQPAQATAWLIKAFQHLGQSIDPGVVELTPKAFLQWAIKHFQLDKVGHTAKRYSLNDLK